jgi:16S rRNA (guanine527-N7)-methyltransferase
MFPDCSFTLIDSINKKIKVVQDIAASIGLTNLQAHHMRAEDVIGKFDFIVSRAVTEFVTFYRWVKPKIEKKGFNDLANGILYLKGGDISGEVGGFKDVKVIELSDFFPEEFFETKKVVYLPYSGK